MAAALLLLIGLLLAFANGANDSFKGVATLYGSGVARYRTALAWGLITTLAGALASLAVGRELVAAFSGSFLDPQVVAEERFPAVAALAAGSTVLLATRLGMPISTTHALVGALAGVALVTASGWAWLLPLGALFFLPLFTSPIVSLVLSWTAHRLAPRAIPQCICAAAVQTAGRPGAIVLPVVGTASECAAHGARPVVTASGLINGLHVLSAGAVGFMRGMNDTPKLLGILAAGGLLTADLSMAMTVGLAMALGGLVGSRRIARRMGEQLTPMSPGQGTISNLLTSAIVGAASCFALPVSTTHVACGTIFGLGAARKELSGKWAGAIAAGWLFTLPVAAILAAGFWMALRPGV